MLENYRNLVSIECFDLTSRSWNDKMVSVTVEDVSVDFTPEEWTLLDVSQKQLFRDVMVETISNLTLLEHLPTEDVMGRFSRNATSASILQKLCEFHGRGKWDNQTPLLRYFPITSWGRYEENTTDEFSSQISILPPLQRPEYLYPMEYFQYRKPFKSLSSLDHNEQFHTPFNADKFRKCEKIYIHTPAEFLTRYKFYEYKEILRESLRFTDDLEISNKAKSYECKQCERTFTGSLQLTLHMRIHSGDRPYECAECGKAFTRASILKKHLRIHSEGRPYECEECGKVFTRSSNFNEHMRIHSGESPYECDECGKAFTRSSVFNEHMRIHSGERPYECEECGKAFNRSSSLT
ncbi:zinc finger protein 614-like isoform X2 [Tenrec ecaudatus]|uniref:zinc finger protein 614-like isoform X2 n=1 Tax=Tenrec ecaudatus TaxID=94439 RepID=UPI003F59063C